MHVQVGHTVKFMTYCCVSMHLGTHVSFPFTGLKTAEHCTASEGQQHWLLSATDETKAVIKQTHYGNNSDAVQKWEKANKNHSMADDPFDENLFLVRYYI